MNLPQCTWPLSRSLKAGVISLLLLLGSLSAQAQTRFVSTTGINSNPASATSWATSTTDLQGAINVSGITEVWVANGIYKPTTATGPDSRTISFAMKNGVSILGGFAGSGSTPDARSPLSSTLSGDIGTTDVNSDNSNHVIYNTGLDATARLDNFVITGGNANGTFTATVGGGMYNNASSPRLTNCLFVSNTATLNGGAMYNSSGSGIASPTLINCAFLTNSANEGGAMYNYATNGTASPTLTNCSFGGNSATEGGAIVNFRSTGASREATQARLAGAGTANSTLTNCVIFGNGGSKTIRNVNGANLIAAYSLFDDTVTGYSTDPTSLTTSTTPYASLTSTQLLAGSPAIDTGNSAATGLVGITTDLDNNPRIMGCRVDMGANEFQANTNQPLTITNQPAAGSAVCVGGAVTASVSASGTVTGYQWVRGGALLSPAQTSSALPLTNVQVGDTGSYSVVITGACNSVTSSAFSLIVSTTTSLGLTLSLQSVNCEASRATLVATPGATSYRFAGPGIDQTSSANILPVSVAGTYSATALFGGCLAAASISTGSVPTVLLIGNGTLSCTTPTVSLSVLGSGAGTVFSGPLGSATGIVSQSDGIERIFVNGYLICRTPLPAYAWAIVNQPGVYRVRIVGANGLESGATITVTGQACPAGGR